MEYYYSLTPKGKIQMIFRHDGVGEKGKAGLSYLSSFGSWQGASDQTIEGRLVPAKDEDALEQIKIWKEGAPR